MHDGPKPPRRLTTPDNARQMVDAIRAQGQLPKRKHHIVLDPLDLEDIVDNVRVRIAGWRDGKPIPIDEDIGRFRALEVPLVEWRKNLRAASHRAADKDEYGLTREQRDWLNEFKTNGGHACKLTKDKINFILRYGLILFLELEVRKNMFVTIGSVSALSASPFTTKCDDRPRDRKFSLYYAFPNFDLQDVGIPEREREKAIATADKRIFIVRSSILSCLRESDVVDDLHGEHLPEIYQGRDLRRLGLAARGKDTLFHIAMMENSRDVTFNIGTAKTPEERGVTYSNAPSEGHNAWTNIWAWRERCYEELVPNIVNMYWMARDAAISAGIEEFERPGGILIGKGWTKDILQKSASDAHDCVVQDVRSGRRKPWGELPY